MSGSNKTFPILTWHFASLPLLIGSAVALITGCARHLEFPPMGETLPYTVKIELPPSITQQTFRYTDSCGQLGEIPIGRQIEEALREGAHRTFKTVIDNENGIDSITPDHVIKIDIRDWFFTLDKDALYDRAPAVLRMNATVRVHDRQGTLLRETEFKVSRLERLRLERAGRSCDYIIDPFIQDTAIELASKIFLDARVALGEPSSLPPIGQESKPDSPDASSTAGPTPAVTPSALSALRFKALLLDENGNLVLEGGEHVRVRVDIVNTGLSPIQNASASLTGTPAVIRQFPATALTVPPLQPGQTKSLEFVATLPPTTQPLQAEIRVTVTESGGAAAPPQTLSLTIHPAGAGADDVDVIPAPALDFQQPQTCLIAIGVGTYRDSRFPSRKYASKDAERVVDYFQALGGVSPSNVRLLQNSKARRDDINEVFTDWLPLHAAKNAVAIVYFSGQAMVDHTGEVLLALYDGSPEAATQLYPLKGIESALARLNAQQTLFIFDGSITTLSSESATKAIAPRWDFNGGSTIRIINGEGVTTGVEDDTHRHGLFTYYLLRGLRGEADSNRSGSVTLGELTNYVRQKVAWAAKSQFDVGQRPLILPPISPADKAASLILSTLASLTSSETP